MRAGLFPSLLSSLADRSRQVNDWTFDAIRLAISSDALPIRYFNNVLNVGDSLNIDLLKQISGKNPIVVKSSLSPHVLAVGSIAHLAGRGSHLWGCGIIGKSTLPVWRRISPTKVYALRGHYTLIEFKRAGLDIDKIALGDPAILSNHFYSPRSRSNQNMIGIIPHYIHRSHISSLAAGCERIVVLDVRKNIREFINDLTSCSYILSSSLHGLILSDAYEIPNQWLKFEELLFGGDFKFFDYYSTTISPDEKPSYYDYKSESSFEEFCLNAVRRASTKRYIHCSKKLIESFPPMPL